MTIGSILIPVATSAVVLFLVSFGLTKFRGGSTPDSLRRGLFGAGLGAGVALIFQLIGIAMRSI